MHEPQARQDYGTAELFLADINNYIPLGSLHVTILSHSTCFSDAWEEVLQASNVLSNTHPASDALSALKSHCRIRLFCRKHHFREHLGSIRVYVLPNDVGGRYFSRNTNTKDIRTLISLLDVSGAAWEATSDPEGPLETLNSTEDDEESLFYIFNTLKSPAPSLPRVVDQYAREAMLQILEPARAPYGLKTVLYPYQRRSAALMIERETNPKLTLDPRLEPLKGPTGRTYYYDRVSGVILSGKREYEEALGGILAETMGLGKTLICLAVILATKGYGPKVPPEYLVDTEPVRTQVGSLMQMTAAAIGRQQIPWKVHFEELARAGEHHQACLAALEENGGSYVIPAPNFRSNRTPRATSKGQKILLCSTTLVIVPANLVMQWRSEISRHVEKGTLNILVLDSLNQPLPPAHELQRYDILMISKQRFEREITGPVISPKGYKPCGCRSSWDCGCSIQPYRSPLRDLHFLRAIVDEGHSFASLGSRTNAIQVFSSLQIERRWIVSGTPGGEMIGVEVGLAAHETPEAPSTVASNRVAYRAHEWAGSPPTIINNQSTLQARKKEHAHEQASKDLERLGRIVVDFLALRPWANTKSGEDAAIWQRYISAHGQRGHRSLRSTLESLVVRHCIEDVEKDLSLPPLHNHVVYLEPSFHDKLSLNVFCLALIANAVTSERIDQDYMFHYKNRRQLDLLISNLRQAGFYWTSFTVHDVSETLRVSQAYLDKEDAHVEPQDRILLGQAIKMGQIALGSNSWRAFSTLHELGLFVRDFPEDAQDAWSLCSETTASRLLLVGASQLGSAQRHVDAQLYAPDPTNGLAATGLDIMQKAQENAMKDALAKATGLGSSLKVKGEDMEKPGVPKSTLSEQPGVMSKHTISRAKPSGSPTKSRAPLVTDGTKCTPAINSSSGIKSALKPSISQGSGVLPADALLARTVLCGTASAKLSYLLDRVLALQEDEKILIFYEGDHIAYYIAQALETVNVRFLIYAKTLTTARRSAYIATFNASEAFRVLIMDVTHAAHGLHIASASRVFIVNPVWQPTVEAQAIKRAHRIGQTKPVYVETLVLKDTLEDHMLQRRKAMTTQEHQKAVKSLLDDSTMGGIIKNAKLIPISDLEVVDIQNQMASLSLPQRVFGRDGIRAVDVANPDADLIMPDEDSPPKQKRGDRKQKGGSAEDPQLMAELTTTRPSRKRRSPSASMHVNSADDTQTIEPKRRHGPPLKKTARFALDAEASQAPKTPTESLFGGNACTDLSRGSSLEALNSAASIQPRNARGP
ncbi:MAG: hypothetical protein FRX48_01836 [Lasallia pustulata]|uniref:Helicase C-terminal domain-containing protein n=1 Tax=Lasallia pustulata TaxID=136370 RepID=A0A5M8Q272_9LECA|nr:MAG: hypothetical protein FRX48_01836 [Lasallia pustulata]